jgi:hypothetical protein
VRGRGTLMAGCIFALLSGAPAAEAARICVKAPAGPAPPGPACASTHTTVSDAFIAAGGSEGRDDVVIGEGVFLGGSASSPVDVLGQGSDTTLVGPNGDNQTVLSVLGTGALGTVTSLDVAIPAGSGNNGILAFDASDVTVSASDSSPSATGISAIGTVNGSEVDLESAWSSTGVRLGFGPGNVFGDTDGALEDSTVVAQTGVAGLGHVRRSTIEGNQAVVGGPDGGALPDASLHIASSAIIGKFGGVAVTAEGIAVSVRNTTVANTEGGGGTAFVVRGKPAPDGGGRLDIASTAARGFGTTIRRFGLAEAPADAAVSYSSVNLQPSAIEQFGNGTLTQGPGNIGVPDARFVDFANGDFRLLPGSPLIDAGDPAPLTPEESATDLGGAPRVDGPRRDIGAHEAASADPVVIVPPPAAGNPTALPRLQILTRTARLDRRGRLRVRLRCLAPGPTCKGRLSARSSRKVRLRRGARKRRLALGRSRAFTIAAGATRTVTLPSARRTRRFIAAKGRLGLRMSATVQGLPRPVTRALSVNRAKKKRR